MSHPAIDFAALQTWLAACSRTKPAAPFRAPAQKPPEKKS